VALRHILEAGGGHVVGLQVRAFAITNSDTAMHANSEKCPATRNRTRDHLIAANVYSQMLYQLSYSRLVIIIAPCHRKYAAACSRLVGYALEFALGAHSGWATRTAWRGADAASLVVTSPFANCRPSPILMPLSRTVNSPPSSGGRAQGP
jgi:hypothetical protein